MKGDGDGREKRERKLCLEMWEEKKERERGARFFQIYILIKREIYYLAPQITSHFHFSFLISKK